jgi:DNA-directed RNA polymerase specialized sigma24 family protein
MGAAGSFPVHRGLSKRFDRNCRSASNGDATVLWVAMRPPSVFVRSLAPVEGQRLKRLSQRAKHASTRQRAMILLASATPMSPLEIARMLLSDESHVRKVIHDFNERWRRRGERRTIIGPRLAA